MLNLLHLTDEQRDILKHVGELGYTHQETAEHLNLSESQLKRRMIALRALADVATTESLLYEYGYALGHEARATRMTEEYQ